MGQKKRKRFKQIVGAGGLVVAMILILVVVASKQKDSIFVMPINQQEGKARNDTDSDIINLELIEYVKFLEVEVQNDVTEVCKATGTAVVYQVNEDGVWMATAAHVLANKSDMDRIVLHAKDASMECRSWVMDEYTDLAYLYLPQEEVVAGIRMVSVETDKESYDKLSSGAVVQVRGYCDGSLKDYVGTLTDGWVYVEDFAEYMMVAQCQIQPGMSGGGLFDEDGYFVGMVCGGNNDGELVAVPWHVMQARFEEKCEVCSLTPNLATLTPKR